LVSKVKRFGPLDISRQGWTGMTEQGNIGIKQVRMWSIFLLVNIRKKMVKEHISGCTRKIFFIN
jgi:hypothetical protein